MSLRTQFEEDTQGSRYADVMNDPRIPFDISLKYLEEPDNLRRMFESELNHDHAALAGVVKGLETLPEVAFYFEHTDGHYTRRYRQSIGVAVRILMENNGWTKTGEKGSLGTREKVKPHTKSSGAYRNKPGSLSMWFTRAERYKKP